MVENVSPGYWFSAMLLAGSATLATQVSAHATFTERTATAGASERLAIGITHGCSGAATEAVRVRIPNGVVGVLPMPKPGWDLEIVAQTLDEPYMDHGQEVTEGVVELRWTGGSLDDAHYDEFVFRAQMPDRADTNLYFPTVQECADGVLRWIEVPAADGAAQPSGDYPAPALNLEAGESSEHGHSHGHSHGHQH